MAIKFTLDHEHFLRHHLCDLMMPQEVFSTVHQTKKSSGHKAEQAPAYARGHKKKQTSDYPNCTTRIYSQKRIASHPIVMSDASFDTMSLLTSPQLMEIPSLALSPVAPVLFNRSDPARSTKLNFAVRVSKSSTAPEAVSTSLGSPPS